MIINLKNKIQNNLWVRPLRGRTAILFLPFLFTIGLWSCKDYVNTEKNYSTHTDSSTTIQYAKGFKIKYIENCKLIEIYSPRDSSLFQKYVLYRDNIPASLSDSKISTYIKIPVHSVTCLSTTHIAFLDKLDLLNVVNGIASKVQVNNAIIKKKAEEESIKEIGEADQIQFEKLAQLHPDIIFTYKIPGNASTATNLINKLKIPQVTVSEFLESHPLGQLEWIKFVAAFFDQEKKATKIFDSIAQAYNELSQLTSKLNNKPTIITSLPWKGQWHLPSGNSLITTYFENAGGTYVMKNDTSEGNLVLPIEKVYGKALNAEYWINAGFADSKEYILNTDKRLEKIAALVNGNIYNNIAIRNENGWSDYYESGVVNPHIILKDLIKILHSELLPDYKLYYYKKLE